MSVVVPFVPGTSPFDEPDTGTGPSEANLLMALATMHKQGRFSQLPESTNIEDRRSEHGRSPPGGFKSDLNPKGATKNRQQWLSAADAQAIDANDR